MFDWATKVFEKLRKLSALAIMLAILAPTLISILPMPAMSAEQQLLMDLGQNICSQNQSSGDHQQNHDDHMKCCVLCVTQHHVFVQSASPKLATAHAITSTPQAQNYYVLAYPRAPPDLRASAPRGPPTSLSI